MTAPNIQPPRDFKDIASPVVPDFLARFADGSLVLDCPRITLRQCSTEKPHIISGRGLITLSGSEFQLRMYADPDPVATAPHPLDALIKGMNWKSGEIIPPDEYYELTATDLSGFEWACQKVEVTVHDAGHGTVLTGRLFDILVHRAVGLAPVVSPYLSMYFFEDLPVPFNQFVMVERKAEGRSLETRTEPTFARVIAGAYAFKVEKKEPSKGSTVLYAHLSEGAFPDGIETRIEESLRYVTLRPVRWSIVERRDGDAREVMVVPRAELTRPLFDEPLDHHRRLCANDYWQLFAAYFQYTLGAKESFNYHPLSAQLFHVIASGTRQLDLMGLMVSVAVEGVLNVAFSDLAKPSQAFRDNIDKVIKLIERLRCVDAVLAKRLQGALPPMKSARPADKLKVLVDAGVVTTDMVKAWQTLRNSTAHAAVRFDPTKYQALMSQCNTVYTMLNRLIFQAIGYSGQYQDFSTIGWPIKPFEVKVLT